MTTLDLQVAANADDATGTLSGSNFSAAQGSSRMDSSTVGDSARWIGGYRFQNVTIPPGSTITAAYVTFVLLAGADDANCDMYAEAIDNAPDFAASPTLVGRALSTATASWIQANEPSPAQSPSLVSIIQEVINRPGWASGNALCLLFIGRSDFTGQFRCVAYDGTPAQAPALHIEYTAGSSGIDGSLTATLDDVTLTATGELPIVGTTAVTLSAATLVAAGELPIAGQVTAVLEPAELSATGSLALEGALTVTMEPATLEAAGALALTGALDTALDDAILLATGVTGEAVTGSLDVLLDDATLNAAGSLMLSGSLSRTLDPATLNADGTLDLSGALSATLDPAILNADGTLHLAAALSTTLDPAVLTADGRLAIVGQLAATLADAVLVATGSGPVLVVVEGAVRSPGRAASIQSPPNTSIIYSEVGHV